MSIDTVNLRFRCPKFRNDRQWGQLFVSDWPVVLTRWVIVLFGWGG